MSLRFIGLRQRSRSLGRALALGSLLAAGISTPALTHDDDDSPMVRTADGRVRGYEKNGVNIFLGIPYAAPPVGNLRWRPPAPVKKWGDTLDATKFANTCPQVTELGPFAGPTSTTEDCLYLNVFTTGKGKKPVIVWIHGGGNVSGETNDYDGTKLATGGPLGTPTVVVTINYRMGLYGFISHPALNSEGHPWGNYGILDFAGRAPLGTTQHRGVRRRPRQRHARRPVRRRDRHGCEPDVARGRRAVSTGDHPKQPHPEWLLRISRDSTDQRQRVCCGSRLSRVGRIGRSLPAQADVGARPAAAGHAQL